MESAKGTMRGTGRNSRLANYTNLIQQSKQPSNQINQNEQPKQITK
jgi:hypothetical protein